MRGPRRSLAGIVAARADEPFLGVLCKEAPGIWTRFQSDLADCDVDFEVLPGVLKAVRPFLSAPRQARESSREWIELRLTLEHLVYYLARVQLFLAGATADAYVHQLDSPRAQRFGWSFAGKQHGPSPAQMLRRWKLLTGKRIARGDFAGEHRLLGDALVFVGEAQHHCSVLLLSLLRGKLSGVA